MNIKLSLRTGSLLNDKAGGVTIASAFFVFGGGQLFPKSPGIL